MKNNHILDLMSKQEALEKKIREKLNIFADINHDKNDLIYFSNHIFIQWLKRVKNITLDPSLPDNQNLAIYLRENKLNAQEFRQMILNKKDQEYIVRNNIQMYFKQGFIYVIRKMTCITIYKMPKDWIKGQK